MKLNTNYIIGLVQSKGSFNVEIRKKNNYIWLEPKFNIILDKSNKDLISNIKDFFGVGYYRSISYGSYQYTVRNIDDLMNVVLPILLEGSNRSISDIFIKNEIATLKGIQFINLIIFKKIVTELYNKTHNLNRYRRRSVIFWDNNLRYSEITLNIINLSYYLNINSTYNFKYYNNELLNYLNDHEKEYVLSENSYQNVIKNMLLSYNENDHMNIDYIKGLLDSCGNINIKLKKNKSDVLRVRVSLSMKQNLNNKKVLEDVQNYLDCGYLTTNDNTIKYDIKNIKDINNKILSKLSKDNVFENNIILDKLMYLQNIIKWMIKNNSSYVKTSEDLNFILSNMYYLNNKDVDLSLEKYVKKNMLKYKLNK